MTPATPHMHHHNKAFFTCGDTSESSHHLREEKDHVFPYRVFCHGANDISHKRSHGIAKTLFYPSLPPGRSTRGSHVKLYHFSQHAHGTVRFGSNSRNGDRNLSRLGYRNSESLISAANVVHWAINMCILSRRLEVINHSIIFMGVPTGVTLNDGR